MKNNIYTVVWCNDEDYDDFAEAVICAGLTKENAEKAIEQIRTWYDKNLKENIKLRGKNIEIKYPYNANCLDYDIYRRTPAKNLALNVSEIPMCEE